MTCTINNLLNGQFASIRQEVANFALAMEQKLRKNDHKTGWKDQPIEAHIRLLKIELMEFDVAIEFLGDEEACKECVDIANFALIIRDKLQARIAAKQAEHTKLINGHPGSPRTTPKQLGSDPVEYNGTCAYPDEN